MAIFFRAVVTAFLVLTMNSLARLTNQDLHPDNNTLVAKLKGYYAVIDSLKIGDIGSRIKIQQTSVNPWAATDAVGSTLKFADRSLVRRIVSRRP